MSDRASGRPSPIDAYLDELFGHLRGAPGTVRRILAETEQHLREAAVAAEARGLDPFAAAEEAVLAFGSPRAIAREFRRTPGWLPPFPALAQLVAALALLAAVGLIAIGVSGLLAGVFGATFGKSFVAGDWPGVTYTPIRCAQFLSLHPEESSCDTAAAAHHFDEVVWYRLDAGALGVAGLGAWALVRRFNRARFGHVRSLPDGFLGAVGGAVFGLAAFGLLLLGLGGLVMGKPGAGEYLSGGTVAPVLFAVFAALLLRTLRERSASHSRDDEERSEA